MKKQCSKCHKIKKLSDFYKHRRFKDGHRNQCKECISNTNKILRQSPDYQERRKQNYEKRKFKHIEYSSKYRSENKDKIANYKKQYYSSPENKKRKNEWQKSFNRKHPEIFAYRCILQNTIRRLNSQQTMHEASLALGYSPYDLKTHIEGLFLPNMVWNNYGEWHIDHIKQVYEFKNGEDISEVNALSNLRPMWKINTIINGVLYEGNLNRKRPNLMP